MTAWLLSVAGAGILGVIVSHLTSKMRLHRVIKTACTYIFLLILIFPVPTVLSNGIDMESCSIFGSDFSYNENVMDSAGNAYFSVVETELNLKLREAGYEAKSEISGRITETGMSVDGVTVTLGGELADSSAAVLAVKAIVADYLEIDQSIIRVELE